LKPTGEGEIEEEIVGDAGGNDGAKFCEGEESDVQVDETTPLKGQISEVNGRAVYVMGEPR
jgi:hypothetical protein